MTAVATPPRAATPAPTEALPVGALRRIPLAELHDSPHNPRQRYDETALLELASSFLQTGQLTPIIVRPRKAGGYEIAAGHRRFRAAKLAVQRQPDGAKYRGVDALEAKVVELSDAAFIEVLNVENLQRDDLHPLEEAQGFKDLMTEAGYDVAKIAARVGRSTRYVYDSLTLLKLTPAAKKLFLDGAFERGHAILLARLSPENQARALGDVKEVANGGGYHSGDSLLLEPDGGAEDELPLHDRVKPVSVREFQKAIQRDIRATPEETDPFLFPDSAHALEAAKEEKLSVIHITREYLASDEVRQADQKQRVFGSEAWKRADGQVDPYEDYRGVRRGRSKPCDWSRYGFVASGPGQGEVFKVCINKQKCTTHWPDHVKRAEAAKKRAKASARGSVKDSGESDSKRLAQEEARRKADADRKARIDDEVARMIKAQAPQWTLAVNALAKQIKLPEAFASWMARDRMLHRDLEDLIQYKELDGVERGQELFDAMRPKLNGGWSRAGYAETAAAQPVALALLFWLNTAAAKAESAIVAEAEKLVAAAEKAEAATRDPKQSTCPQCGAKPGSPCMRPSGHPVFGGDFHSGRGKKPTGKKAKKGKRS